MYLCGFWEDYLSKGKGAKKGGKYGLLPYSENCSYFISCQIGQIFVGAEGLLVPSCFCPPMENLFYR